MSGHGPLADSRKLVFYLAVGSVALFLLKSLQTIVLLTFLALLIALVIDAIARPGIRLLRMPRGLAVVLAGILLVIGGTGILIFIGTPLIEQATSLVQTLPEHEARLNVLIKRYEQEHPWIERFLPAPSIRVKDEEKPKPADVAKQALVSARVFVEWAGRAVAVFFLALFLAWDPERWLRGIAPLVPGAPPEQRVELFRRIGAALRSYLFTIGVYIVAMASMWTLGLWLIGIEYALVFGLIGGLVEIVPYVGPFIGFLPPLLFSLSYGLGTVTLLILLYIVLHIVEGYMLVPWLLHDRENLPPPVVVGSILVFGTLFGSLGIVLAVPLALMIYVCLNETVYRDSPPPR